MVLEEALRFREPINSHVVHGFYRGGDEGLRGIRVIEQDGDIAKEVAMIVYPAGNATAFFLRYLVASQEAQFPQIDYRFFDREIYPLISDQRAQGMYEMLDTLRRDGAITDDELEMEKESTEKWYLAVANPEGLATDMLKQLLERLRPETVDTAQRRIPTLSK
ncbi:MAG TPA: hypothetical protein VJB90_05560 [Candidatus Nanoarchaeia archaeon]|nr:hypothetical protein [Candidatus Nanoarchaeia archaeon]